MLDAQTPEERERLTGSLASLPPGVLARLIDLAGQQCEHPSHDWEWGEIDE
jgi:hypothetical protein